MEDGGMTGGPAGPAGFMHAALLYRSDAEYAQAVMGMVGADDACGTCVALVGTGPRDGLVRDALRVTASAVTAADITELGRDPARLIPAAQSFADEHRGPAGMRGVRGGVAGPFPGRAARAVPLRGAVQSGAVRAAGHLGVPV